MRIVDSNGTEIVSPDFSLGRVKPDKLLIAHHPAVEGVEAKWHYVVIAEYPNGGKDLERVIDVPGVEAVDAWDEYEDVLRFILYTEDELKEIENNRKPTLDDRISELEEALILLLSRATQ